MDMCRLIGCASPVPTTLTEWIGNGKAPVNGVRQPSQSTLLTVPQMGRVLEFYHQDQRRRHDRHRWISCPARRRDWRVHRRADQCRARPSVDGELLLMTNN